MIKVARLTPMIPRGTIMGKRTSGPPLSDGGWFDMRDLGAVFDDEEPLPHPAQDQAQ
jgi:hypothetical protein